MIVVLAIYFDPVPLLKILQVMQDFCCQNCNIDLSWFGFEKNKCTSFELVDITFSDVWCTVYKSVVMILGVTTNDQNTAMNQTPRQSEKLWTLIHFRVNINKNFFRDILWYIWTQIPFRKYFRLTSCHQSVHLGGKPGTSCLQRAVWSDVSTGKSLFKCSCSKSKTTPNQLVYWVVT